MRVAALLAACLLSPACGSDPPATIPPETTTSASRSLQPDFVGKIWISPDTSAPRGTLRIFLPDGTLVMDSCWETYRLARWETVGERRIAWAEDTARIEAEIVRAAPDQLDLRLQLVGGDVRNESYRLAQVPFVCPDMPR
jgi:hypothetical protein